MNDFGCCSSSFLVPLPLLEACLGVVVGGVATHLLVTEDRRVVLSTRKNSDLVSHDSQIRPAEGVTLSQADPMF